MPISARFEKDAGLAIFTHRGVIPDEEFLGTYRTIYRDPRFEKTFNTLVDLREAESSIRSPEALRTMVNIRDRWLGDLEVNPRVAVVAPADISFGLARMYEAYSDALPFEFIVFKDIGAALAWLGAPEDLLENDPTDPD